MLARVTTRYPDTLHRFNGVHRSSAKSWQKLRLGTSSVVYARRGRLQGIDQVLTQGVHGSLPGRRINLAPAQLTGDTLSLFQRVASGSCLARRCFARNCLVMNCLVMRRALGSHLQTRCWCQPGLSQVSGQFLGKFHAIEKRQHGLHRGRWCGDLNLCGTAHGDHPVC